MIGIPQESTTNIHPPEPVEYRVYSDLKQISGLSQQWDELVRASPGNAAFRSIDWYTASCRKEASWVPFVLVASRGREIVCILPFVTDLDDGTAKFPHHGADYNDIVARPDNPVLIADLLDYAVSSANGCRRLVLSRLRPDSCCVGAFHFLAQRTNIKCQWREIDNYWYIQLPSSFDGYLASRSRTFRKDVRRTLHHLEQEGMALCELHPSELRPVDLPLLLTKLSVSRHKEKCSFVRAPNIQRILNESLPPLFEKGFLRAFAVLWKAQIVALDLCMVAGNGLVTWNGGFLSEIEHCSPGTALFAFGIQQAIAMGFREFDFTRGDEEYKRRWANSRYSVCEIELTTGTA